MEINGDSFISWSDGGYPRPTLCRNYWLDLRGGWDFWEDSKDRGLDERWYVAHEAQVQTIQVPFPPGSSLSGVEQPRADVLWYRRVISAAELAQAGHVENGAGRVLLHFEAVDYHAHVWANGELVATHEGGFTTFTADITAQVRQSREVVIVVRSHDIRADASQPRGKQDWRHRPHGIWYEQSAGIWRDVWVEAVPDLHIKHLVWTSDIDRAQAILEAEFSSFLDYGATIDITVSQKGTELARVQAKVQGSLATIVIPIPQIANKLEWDTYLWSPEHPNLLDAVVELSANSSTDRVISYVGLRSVDASRRYLRINREPVYVRGVLDQGYWSESYLTAPSHEALKADLILAKQMGFNTMRVHQRTPDRRYLTWADRLGLMVWAEFPAPYEYTREAATRTMTEWSAVLLRDRSHPSICVWVPVNESWGVSSIQTQPMQRDFVDAITAMTRALDDTRLVIANDGWEQRHTDLVTIHDYGTTGQEILPNYPDVQAMKEVLHLDGPQGRPTLLAEPWNDDKPVMVSEFGGISLLEDRQDAWGYAVVRSAQELSKRIGELYDALHASPILAGHCYTQLTDTGQETNGLLYADRSPKLPLSEVKTIVTSGEKYFRSHRRPRSIAENSARGSDQ